MFLLGGKNNTTNKSFSIQIGTLLIIKTIDTYFLQIVIGTKIIKINWWIFKGKCKVYTLDH